MTSTRTIRIAALAAAVALGTTGAFAGPDPASPTPVVPPPPPPPPVIITLTPAQIAAVQASVQALLNDPPTSIPLSLQTRLLSVLRLLLAAPEVLAQLGFTPAQIEALMTQIGSIPTFVD